jgi:hypothetical protein
MLAVIAAAIAVHASAAGAARCSEKSIRVLPPATQGTATQALATISVRNLGPACRIDETLTFSVLRRGARLTSIGGNPLRVRIVGTFAHGTTALINAWWANWCGVRDSLTAHAAIGTASASSRYAVLPVCLEHSAPSKLTFVRQGGSRPAWAAAIRVR